MTMGFPLQMDLYGAGWLGPPHRRHPVGQPGRVGDHGPQCVAGDIEAPGSLDFRHLPPPHRLASSVNPRAPARARGKTAFLVTRMAHSARLRADPAGETAAVHRGLVACSALS